MSERINEITTLDDLREYVHTTLCEKENLVQDQFQMIEMELKKCGRNCGIQFSIHGPRQVRLSAVWASDRNQLFFYDALGNRFKKIQLSGRVEILSEQAA